MLEWLQEDKTVYTLAEGVNQYYVQVQFDPRYGNAEEAEKIARRFAHSERTLHELKELVKFLETYGFGVRISGEPVDYLNNARQAISLNDTSSPA